VEIEDATDGIRLTKAQLVECVREVIDVYSTAHNQLMRRRFGQHGRITVLERAATYVALKAFLEAFDMDGVFTEEGAVEELNALATAFHVETSPIESGAAGKLAKA
jgi:hypothetical protein